MASFKSLLISRILIAFITTFYYNSLASASEPKNDHDHDHVHVYVHIKFSTISAAPAVLPGPVNSPLSSPDHSLASPTLSPDITPLFPSPRKEPLSPSESSLPTIPSSPSPPNPDTILAPGPGVAFPPSGSLLTSTANSLSMSHYQPLRTVFVLFIILVVSCLM